LFSESNFIDQLSGLVVQYAVTLDCKRFVVITGEQVKTFQINLFTKWIAALGKYSILGPQNRSLVSDLLFAASHEQAGPLTVTYSERITSQPELNFSIADHPRTCELGLIPSLQKHFLHWEPLSGARLNIAPRQLSRWFPSVT